ncbi:hypothetical protein JCM10908_004428 [Rhodotorula pacifica]|uniref:uncharacterized protein n=1 Tax=Rhodotorula pacifica TaxID=1495444 RepID=UPI0031702B05
MTTHDQVELHLYSYNAPPDIYQQQTATAARLIQSCLFAKPYKSHRGEAWPRDEPIKPRPETTWYHTTATAPPSSSALTSRATVGPSHAPAAAVAAEEDFDHLPDFQHWHSPPPPSAACKLHSASTTKPTPPPLPTAEPDGPAGVADISMLSIPPPPPSAPPSPRKRSRQPDSSSTAQRSSGEQQLQQQPRSILRKRTPSSGIAGTWTSHPASSSSTAAAILRSDELLNNNRKSSTAGKRALSSAGGNATAGSVSGSSKEKQEKKKKTVRVEIPRSSDARMAAVAAATAEVAQNAKGTVRLPSGSTSPLRRAGRTSAVTNNGIDNDNNGRGGGRRPIASSRLSRRGALSETVGAIDGHPPSSSPPPTRTTSTTTRTKRARPASESSCSNSSPGGKALLPPAAIASAPVVEAVDLSRGAIERCIPAPYAHRVLDPLLLPATDTTDPNPLRQHPSPVLHSFVDPEYRHRHRPPPPRIRTEVSLPFDSERTIEFLSPGRKGAWIIPVSEAEDGEGIVLGITSKAVWRSTETGAATEGGGGGGYLSRSRSAPSTTTTTTSTTYAKSAKPPPCSKTVDAPPPLEWTDARLSLLWSFLTDLRTGGRFGNIRAQAIPTTSRGGGSVLKVNCEAHLALALRGVLDQVSVKVLMEAQEGQKGDKKSVKKRKGHEGEEEERRKDAEKWFKGRALLWVDEQSRAILTA